MLTETNLNQFTGTTCYYRYMLGLKLPMASNTWLMKPERTGCSTSSPRIKPTPRFAENPSKSVRAEAVSVRFDSSRPKNRSSITSVGSK